ncbi:hypothetical protein JXL21_06655 [Candidatus Bathyarchaeota archaeon]|nr:hypothetical protein [Candidatus Bathyarchaeota archaeon]
MSYDPEYRKWVERQTAKIKADGTGDPDEVYQVYRGLPVFRIKVEDDPPQHRYVAPGSRARDYDKLREKIDQKLDEPQSRQAKPKTPTGGGKASNEAKYFELWQNCQVELEDMKRREAKTLSKVKELQDKMEELSKTQTQLKSQLNASEAQLKELKKK